MKNNLRIGGINNEQTECDRCGRMELRGTVILINDDGEVGRYGTTCAGKELGIKVTRQDALNVESHRAYMVRNELIKGLKALERGDLPSVRMYLDGAREYGVIKPNEKRAEEKLAAALA